MAFVSDEVFYVRCRTYARRRISNREDAEDTASEMYMLWVRFNRQFKLLARLFVDVRRADTKFNRKTRKSQEPLTAMRDNSSYLDVADAVREGSQISDEVLSVLRSKLRKLDRIEALERGDIVPAKTGRPRAFPERPLTEPIEIPRPKRGRPRKNPARK